MRAILTSSPDAGKAQQALLLWDRATRRPLGSNQYDRGVDNIHSLDARPSGTSAAAGLRRLDKEAAAGNSVAVDVLDAVMGEVVEHVFAPIAVEQFDEVRVYGAVGPFRVILARARGASPEAALALIIAGTWHGMKVLQRFEDGPPTRGAADRMAAVALDVLNLSAWEWPDDVFEDDDGPNRAA